MATMQIVKGRTLTHGQEVFVYYNLHKHVFSVKDVKTGLVVAHTSVIHLENATFKVSEAGRQRVLAEKRKNVHAGVRGTFVRPEPWNLTSVKRATYNPYLFSSFVDVASQEPLEQASEVMLVNKKIYYK